MLHTDKTTENMKVIKKKEEYQNYLDALTWLDVGQHDNISMMFASKKMSIQEGMKSYKD